MIIRGVMITLYVIQVLAIVYGVWLLQKLWNGQVNINEVFKVYIDRSGAVLEELRKLEQQYHQDRLPYTGPDRRKQ